MRNQFIKLTSGWIPIFVMLLFATALVMGRPDGGLIEARSLPAIVSPIADSIEMPQLFHGRYGRYE